MMVAITLDDWIVCTLISSCIRDRTTMHAPCPRRTTQTLMIKVEFLVTFYLSVTTRNEKSKKPAMSMRDPTTEDLLGLSLMMIKPGMRPISE
jgi:hypothetical protein